MTEQRLRDRLSVFLLCGQVAVPAIVFVAYLADGFTKDEFTQLNEIIIPMVAAIGGFAVTHIVKSKGRREAAKGKQLTPLFVGTAAALPIFFLVSIATVVGLKVFNLGMRDFDDLKAALATLNTLFAGVSGTLLAALFEKE